MLVWRKVKVKVKWIYTFIYKGDIYRTVCMLQYYVALPLQLCTVVRAVLEGHSTGSGLDLA